jgi:hypothetical protein
LAFAGDIRHSLAPLAASGLLIAAAAFSSSPAHATETFGGIGTTGFELGIAERMGSNGGLRLSAEFLNLGRDFERNGATYDTRLKFSSLGVYGDYFFSGDFRLTGGAVFGTRKASGNAVASNGTITINGTTYPAAGERVDAEVKFPSAAPYLGIGYGHRQSGKGFSFYADLGAVVGKADARLTPSAGILAAAGQANIDAEQANLQDSADKLKVYPALKFGVGYAF